MTEALLRGAAAGYGIAIPVGAVALLIVGTGIRCGFACGLSAGAGAATADLAYALVATAAGAAVAARLAPWEGAIRAGSALVLALIAGWGLWGISRRGSTTIGPSTATAADLMGTYVRFLGLTLVNPLTVVYFTALVLGAGIAGGAGYTTAFAIGAFTASLSWQTLLAALGAFGRRGLSPGVRRAALLVGNLVILGLAFDLVI